MRKKTDDFESKRVQEIKDEIERFSCVTCHDPECVFYSKEKTANMCLMMKKSCQSVPPLMCQNIQKAWNVGYYDGESGEQFAEKFRKVMKTIDEGV